MNHIFIKNFHNLKLNQVWYETQDLISNKNYCKFWFLFQTDKYTYQSIDFCIIN